MVVQVLHLTVMDSNDDLDVENRLKEINIEDLKEDIAEEIASVGASIKHPLQNCWSFWYYKNDRSKDWLENQKIITKFSTVEDFWAVYNHIQPASKIVLGCDYSVFKEGIQPMWEDQQNRKGGRWVINLDKKKRNTELDSFWLETLLCLIGEAFEELGDEICGAVINLRSKGDKLGLWTADATHAEANIRIGRILKARLRIPPEVVLAYESHADSQTKSGSTAKTRYHV